MISSQRVKEALVSALLIGQKYPISNAASSTMCVFQSTGSDVSIQNTRLKRLEEACENVSSALVTEKSFHFIIN